MTPNQPTQNILQGIISDWRKPDPLESKPDCLSNALLIQRGFKPNDESFLNPKLESDPFYPMFGELADWILAKKPGTVFINADYDADGTTTAAILLKTLSSIGWKGKVFIPSRAEHGYGVHMSEIERSFQNSPFDLLIAGDCGATMLKIAKNAQAVFDPQAFQLLHGRRDQEPHGEDRYAQPDLRGDVQAGHAHAIISRRGSSRRRCWPHH